MYILLKKKVLFIIKNSVAFLRDERNLLKTMII